MTITRWTPENVIGRVEAGFKPAAEGLEKVAQGLAPRRSGTLAASTHFLQTGTTSGALKADAPYAAPVIKGTKAHEIDVRNAEAMPIGRFGFATRVQHPATPPHPYLQEAAPSFRSIFVETVRGLFHLGF